MLRESPLWKRNASVDGLEEVPCRGCGPSTYIVHEMLAMVEVFAVAVVLTSRMPRAMVALDVAL